MMTAFRMTMNPEMDTAPFGNRPLLAEVTGTSFRAAGVVVNIRRKK
ncbi:MAG: hypothetical protein ABJC26_03430 [Gemmatimonadaceae bacterium]